eukprot:5643441-Pleurochrysis_carterae.AAC.2
MATPTLSTATFAPRSDQIMPRTIRTDDQPISMLRVSMQRRVKDHHTSSRASGSGRTLKATVSFGVEADNAPSPCRPRNLSSE